MLLSAQEQEELTANLYATACIWEAAFEEQCPLSRLLLRVVRALERGEAVQRRGGFREGGEPWLQNNRPLK